MVFDKSVQALMVEQGMRYCAQMTETEKESTKHTMERKAVPARMSIIKGFLVQELVIKPKDKGIEGGYRKQHR